MKPRIILLLNVDPHVERAVETAVFASRHGLRIARTTDAALRLFQEGLDDVDLILFDLDSGMHPGTLLGAIEWCRHDAPVVVLTSLAATQLAILSIAKGVVECLAKPITAPQVKKAIERFACAAAGG